MTANAARIGCTLLNRPKDSSETRPLDTRDSTAGRQVEPSSISNQMVGGNSAQP